ncbi:MAG: hypothetical protein JXX14_11020 [Deltaproteobacteria bacterium]|nr:hypothetical protein [Deltaproteobacteria bacterium]
MRLQLWCPHIVIFVSFLFNPSCNRVDNPPAKTAAVSFQRGDTDRSDTDTADFETEAETTDDETDELENETAFQIDALASPNALTSCQALVREYRQKKEALKTPRRASLTAALRSLGYSENEFFDGKHSMVQLFYLPTYFVPPKTGTEWKWHHWYVGEPEKGKNGCWAIVPFDTWGYALAYADVDGNISRFKVFESEPENLATNQVMIQDLDDDGYEEVVWKTKDNIRGTRVWALTSSGGTLAAMAPFTDGSYRGTCDTLFGETDRDGKFEPLICDQFSVSAQCQEFDEEYYENTGPEDCTVIDSIYYPMTFDGDATFSLEPQKIAQSIANQCESPMKVTDISHAVMCARAMGGCTATIRKDIRKAEGDWYAGWNGNEIPDTLYPNHYYNAAIRMAGEYVPAYQVAPLCPEKHQDNTRFNTAYCHQGNVTISDDMKNFADVQRLTCINGSLVISNVKKKRLALAKLTFVTGDIRLTGNDRLTAVSLPLLSEIGGHLIVESNTALADIGGFSALKTIGGGLYIEGKNNRLKSLKPLASLAAIGGDIVIADTAVLENLDGLQTLNAVHGELHLFNNAGLQNLNALRNVATVRGDLLVDWNPRLANLGGLEGIENATAGIRIRHNALLSELNAFMNVQHVQGDLIIQDNQSLKAIAGLNNITQIDGDLLLGANPSLRDCSALGRLNRINGNLKILEMQQLKDLGFLSNVSSVKGRILLLNNERMESVKGLFALGGTVTALQIENLPQLRNLDGLLGINAVTDVLGLYQLNALQNIDHLKHLKQAGRIILHNCKELTNINGLLGVASIGAGLHLTQLPRIEGIEGAGNIRVMDGDLTIKKCDRIKSLKPLRHLTKIGGSVALEENPLIENLDGLNNVTHIDGDLRLVQNDHLENIDDLQNIHAIGGSIYLKNNNRLVHLNGLRGIRSTVGGIYVFHHALLANIAALRGITTSKAGVIINQCEKLKTLNGLNGLTRIESFGLKIQDNEALEDTTALQSLRVLNGDYLVMANPRIRVLHGLNNLRGKINNFEIIGNDALTEIPGIARFTKIEGRLAIQKNDRLVSIKALGNVRMVGNRLDIAENPALPTLDGLQNLVAVTPDHRGTEMGISVSIRNNPQLKSIRELLSLTTVTRGLNIKGNEQLPYTDICHIFKQTGVLPNKHQIADNLQDDAFDAASGTCKPGIAQ